MTDDRQSYVGFMTEAGDAGLVAPDRAGGGTGHGSSGVRAMCSGKPRWSHDGSVMRLLLVRHAHAGSKRSFDGSDEARPLDGRGRRQARSLVGPLARRAPAQIVSSPALRCVQTVQPLADRLGLAVEVSSSLAVGKAPEALGLVLSLARATGETVVACTHREVLAVLLPELARLFGEPLGHRPPGAKGATWVLDFGRDALRGVRYLSAPS